MKWAPYYPAYAEPTKSIADGAEVAVESQDGNKSNGEEGKEAHMVGAVEEDSRKLTQDVEVADIGCGFGGLLVALAPKLPNTLLLGQCKFASLRLLN